VHQGGAANAISFFWDGDDLLNDYIGGGVSVRYDVLDGEVFGHKGGANRYLYVPDPLGSVNHLLDTSQTIAGTYVYWPYGEVVTHTGASTPMQFLGARGYETQIVNRIHTGLRYYRPDLSRFACGVGLPGAGGGGGEMGDPLPPSNPCRDGWLHRWATVWECLEPGMGTTCEGCSVLTPGRVPEDDPCRDPGIAHPQGRTCYCPTVLGQTPGREAEGVGNQVAAVNEAQWGCGAKLEVRRLPSGPTKRVLRVDAGPYGPDGNPRRNYIDLHRAVFGVPPGGRWEVCVRAVKTTPGQAGPDIDGRLSPCPKGYGR